jgi:hypothetical protein
MRGLHEPFLAALETPGPIAAGAVKAAFAVMGEDRLPYYYPLEAYARLGLAEDAIRVVRRAAEQDRIEDTQPLFGPSTAVIRRDPAFLAIAETLGLVDYWRSAGWPDFCEEADLSYRCEAIAARG